MDVDMLPPCPEIYNPIPFIPVTATWCYLHPSVILVQVLLQTINMLFVC